MVAYVIEMLPFVCCNKLDGMIIIPTWILLSWHAYNFSIWILFFVHLLNFLPVYVNLSSAFKKIMLMILPHAPYSFGHLKKSMARHLNKAPLQREMLQYGKLTLNYQRSGLFSCSWRGTVTASSQSSIFQPESQGHWCATNDPQVCCRSFGGKYFLRTQS